jgi:glycosyltransferase involved in cell wall biosynthesis
MSSAPLISIVLPTYNGGRYLRESVESCRAQTFTNWELILVDDASTDDTPALLRQFATQDSRIRFIQNPVNSKLPKSLNRGFACARGDFLTWTSDDNCYRPEALAKMLAFLEANPGVDVVYTNYTVIDEAGSPKKVGPPGAGPLADLLVRNVIGACFLYRRQVHERLGGYAEDLFLVEDYDFWLRASTRFQFAFLNQDLYLYRWHARSLSLQQRQNIRLAREKSLARNLGHMRWLPGPARARAWQDLIGQAIARRDRPAARSYFRDSLPSHPFLPIRLGFTALAFLYFPPPLYKWAQRLEAAQQRRRVRCVAREIIRLTAPGRFILVDEEQLRGELALGQAVPFLEKDGQWWGAPADDETALRELERLRQAGATHIVFVWPCFWWLQHYQEFHQVLRACHRCVLENERLVVFALNA